ncbi:hypothetical protein ABZZ79_03260 [Streptomyces sp. NPDC006458]|uniref:hypothetical protein n=1 Tax=Streptomyces sp. NPDC006458 TaxID=3154302 RepID=UPI0033BE276A
MARLTAREAAQLLAQQGRHSHLHSEHETVCISGDCIPTPAVLDGTTHTTIRPSRYL